MGPKRQLNQMKQKASTAIKREAKKIGKSLLTQAKREIKSSGRTMAFGALRTLTGMGDYKVNGLIRGGSTSNVPSFGSQHVRIRRREYLGTITSSSTVGAFDIQKFQVNPGLFATFPWLASLAQSYESWKPHGIVFEFKSTSGSAVGSTNTALGQVILAAQYNSFAVDPIDKIHMEGLSNALSIAPYEDGLCGLECRPKDRQASTLLVRNSSVSSMSLAGQDQIFDLCDFFVATNGLQAASVTVGDLWVTYDIEFFNPVVPTAAPAIPSFRYFSNNTVTSVNPFGASATITNIGGLCCTYDTPQQISLSNLVVGQYYFVEARFTHGAAPAANSWVLTYGGFRSVYGHQSPQAGLVNCTSQYVNALVQANDTAGAINLTGGGGLANYVDITLYFTPVAFTA